MKFILDSELIVIGVSKRLNNGGQRGRNYHQKRFWNLYFYDEDGIFRTKRVTWWQAMMLKRKKVKVMKV